MNQPDNAVELPIGAVWREDGIVVHRANNAIRTSELVGKLFEVIRELFDGEPGTVLLDARDWQGSTPGGWLAAIDNIDATVTRAAMLVDDDSSAALGPFPAVVGRFMVPFKVFTDEVEALAFLRESDG